MGSDAGCRAGHRAPWPCRFEFQCCGGCWRNPRRARRLYVAGTLGVPFAKNSVVATLSPRWSGSTSSPSGASGARVCSGSIATGTPRLFVVIEPAESDDVHGRVPSTRSFRVTACVDSFSHEDVVGAPIRTVATVPPARQMERQTGSDEWPRTCHSRWKACCRRPTAFRRTGARSTVTTCPGTCERTTEGSCGCSIGRTRAGVRHWPTWSATSWPTIRSAGAALDRIATVVRTTVGAESSGGAARGCDFLALTREPSAQ